MNAKVTYTQKWLGQILKHTEYRELDDERFGEEAFNIRYALFEDPLVQSVEIQVEIEQGKWMEF